MRQFWLIFLVYFIGREFGDCLSLNEKIKRDVSNAAVPTPNSKKLNQADIEDTTHWFNSATVSLTNKLNLRRIEKKAKNLILFLGDGMSVSTVTASRIYKGQAIQGLKFGEEGQLHMDTFPFIGASKTYCADYQVADSACSATAYLCGTKANVKTIGVTPTVLYNNCTLQMDEKNQVSSILAWAQAAGMSTGIVTTTAVTHASPAGTYAHVANREWENDKEVQESGQNSELCDDIAKQLVTKLPGNKINVIFGGGRANFLNQTEMDVENVTLPGGSRSDGRNLIQEWLSRHEQANAKYITSRDQLLSLNTKKTDNVLGLFASGHVAYADEQPKDNDPSLAEMTDVAIKILSRNPNGFFLFVEGGRIDHAHHENLGKRAIVETIQFDDAIKLADDSTSDQNTLIVVTSDHSQLFSMAGYSQRGNSILGFANGNSQDIATADQLPYTTLGYMNGHSGLSGYRAQTPVNQTQCQRANITKDSINAFDYAQVSYVPLVNKATHAGEDVLIFAKGPWAHLFSGVNEQSFIPHAMAFAGCIHPSGQNSCDNHNRSSRASVQDLSNIWKFLVFCLLMMRCVGFEK